MIGEREGALREKGCVHKPSKQESHIQTYPYDSVFHTHISVCFKTTYQITNGYSGLKRVVMNGPRETCSWIRMEETDGEDREMREGKLMLKHQPYRPLAAVSPAEDCALRPEKTGTAGTFG